MCLHPRCKRSPYTPDDRFSAALWQKQLSRALGVEPEHPLCRHQQIAAEHFCRGCSKNVVECSVCPLAENIVRRDDKPYRSQMHVVNPLQRVQMKHPWNKMHQIFLLQDYVQAAGGIDHFVPARVDWLLGVCSVQLCLGASRFLASHQARGGEHATQQKLDSLQAFLRKVNEARDAKSGVDCADVQGKGGSYKTQVGLKRKPLEDQVALAPSRLAQTDAGAAVGSKRRDRPGGRTPTPKGPERPSPV